MTSNKKPARRERREFSEECKAEAGRMVGKRPELPCHRWSGGGRMLSGDCCWGIVARGTPPPGGADYC